MGGGRAPRHRAGCAGTQPGPARGARGPGANLLHLHLHLGAASFGGPPKCRARSPLWPETRCLRQETRMAPSGATMPAVQRPASRKWQKIRVIPRVIPENTWGLLRGYFRVLPALDTRDRRGSLPGLPYCCSVGLTLATVVGEPHCCSVVTVNVRPCPAGARSAPEGG